MSEKKITCNICQSNVDIFSEHYQTYSCRPLGSALSRAELVEELCSVGSALSRAELVEELCPKCYDNRKTVSSEERDAKLHNILDMSEKLQDYRMRIPVFDATLNHAIQGKFSTAQMYTALLEVMCKAYLNLQAELMSRSLTARPTIIIKE